jgi:hypothetical protein
MRPTSSREVARQLVAREVKGSDDPAATIAALQRTCARVSENLRRSVGEDGHDALLTRAVTRAQTEHPALRDVGHTGGAGIRLDGLTASVDRHGLPVVAAAVESMLAALVDVLSGLIGADMVLNILDNDGGPTRPPSGRQSQ